MRNIEINLAGVKNFDDFHNEISSKLNFPEYYGRNLDAMHDCLTDIADDMEIVFFGVKACRELSPEMSAYIDGFERMLEDTSKECENLTFILLAENPDEDMDRSLDIVDESNARFGAGEYSKNG